MFRCVIKGLNTIGKAAVTVVKAVVDRVESAVRRLWRAHSARMKSDTSYAAAAAIVLGTAFGRVPVKEALAAVLAVLLGIALSGHGSDARPSDEQGGSPWHTDPDWDTDPDFA